MFVNIGYYLIEKTLNPKKNIPLLTASDCVCNIYPQSDIYLDNTKMLIDSEYLRCLGLTVDETLQFMKEIQKLRAENKIAVDRRFSCIDDARRVYNKYLKRVENIQLISISVEEKELPILREEMEEEFFFVKDKEKGEEIGYDILGWDLTGFHSYFCNELDEIINAKYIIEYNEFGLIKNSFENVKTFVRLIEGQGEQVEWLPFKVEGYHL